MTERLTTLLNREADTFEVPAAPAADILGVGRRLRRRRTGTIWATAAVAVAVVAGGSVLIGTGGDGRDIAPAASPPVQVAWAVDDTVYVGTDGRPVQMPEVAQSLYYTSAGIVVRTNKDGASDGGAPFHFQLVKADGTTSTLDVAHGDVVPSSDPTQPYFAWAKMTNGQIQVVVHNVLTDEDVATVDVPGTFDWGGWEAPPVALSGDQVYVGTNGRTAVVNWRTGAATTTDVLPGNKLPEVFGGRTVTTSGQGTKHASAAVVDVATGRVLLDLTVQGFDRVTLSPDGRFAMVVQEVFDPPVPTTVYDVSSGHPVRFPDSSTGYGWTIDDDLFQVSGNSLSVCSATTGTCQESPVPPVGNRAFPHYAGSPSDS